MQQHVFYVAATCRLMGVKHIVMSPGSRSAPLVFAFVKHKSFTIHTIPDERSAAYFALGIAQQTNSPVVIFCTSGTAAANYLPGIAEAFYQRIPLIVITADRPENLLNQQDGQMINQQHLFGSHARGFYQLGDGDVAQVTQTVAKAIIKAKKFNGPVHINIPLREPLYPDAINENRDATNVAIKNWLSEHLNSKSINGNGFSLLEKKWISSKRRLVIIGQSTMQEKWITSLNKIQQQGDVVILADVVSNMTQFCTAPHFDKMLSSADDTMLESLKPDLILSFGGPLLSKSLKNWLKEIKPGAHFRIQTEAEKIDTYGNVTNVINAKATDALNHLSEIVWNESPENDYVKTWKNAEDKIVKKIADFIDRNNWSELHATNLILKSLPDCSNLQLANSSVVRYASLLGFNNNSVIVNGNRGASGIDGCTSTAAGAASVNLRTTVLLTGDLAFLYDRNGLWMNEIPGNLRIIVFNNNGGGIFKLIDGPSRHKAYEKYFTTPTPQQIKLTAQQCNLDYYVCSNMSGLKKVLPQFLNPEKNKAALLELNFDMEQNVKIFSQFKKIKIK